MNRILAFAAPAYVAEVPVRSYQRLKDRAARMRMADGHSIWNKANLTFAERRVLVLGIGRRHVSRKANGQ